MRRLLALLLVLPLAAQAEVWGFVDDGGTPAFAVQQKDGRYELFFKGSEAELADQAKRKQIAAEAMSDAALTPVEPDTPAAARLRRFVESSAQYKGLRKLLEGAASTHALDVELLQALIATESAFDAQAVSPKGAVGLMQLMPATAERYGVTADAKQPVDRKLVDPRTNIKAGARHLANLVKQFPGRLDLALAAYNAGEGAVQRAGNKIPAYPETQAYVKNVLQLYGLLKPGATSPTAAATGGQASSKNRVRQSFAAGRSDIHVTR